MTVLDIIILIMLIFGALKGFKSGVITQTVSLIGTIFVLVLSFMLKSPVTLFLCKTFPFFTFKGQLAGVTVINLLVYEIIAFFILFFVLLTLVRFALCVSRILDKIINLTVFFTIPNKLLGLVLGVIEQYIIIFIILYILSLPIFDFDFLNNSKYKQLILENTPVLNVYGDKIVSVGNELISLKDRYKEEKDKEKINLESLDVLLKYDITTVEAVDELVKIEKLKINGVETILSKYREN